MRKKTRALIAAAVAAAGAAGVIATTATSAQAAGPTIPAHVFAPYFEAYNGDSLSGLSQQSGAKFLNMAFIQAATKGSCTVYWDGDTSQPIGNTFAGDIATVRANGGDVIPSFGGYTADNTGTEIADSCTNVSSIAAAYENVITTYNVTRLDLDTEDNSLTNTAGIDRRNKAIKMVEDWAAANNRTVQFSYTLPSTENGLASSGLAVLQNAVSNGARIDVVNIMTFDYYDGGTHEMAQNSESAATGLHGQLASLYPGDSSTQLWNMIGVTEMIGIDDYGAAETFTTADAPTMEQWATQQGIAELSFWALQRDNGGCVGTSGSDTCSGISQSTWYFSNTFEPFTSGATAGSPSPSTSPSGGGSPSASPSVSASVSVSPSSSAGTGSCVAAAWVSTLAYNGGAVVSYNGHTWSAKWWTQGDVPGNNAQNVWSDNGACTGSGGGTPSASASATSGSGGSCSTLAAWSASTAYNGGATVSYNTHKWTAKWWTQGDIPGNNAQNVWTDNGTC
nr:chitinase [Actinocrinis sp.]